MNALLQLIATLAALFFMDAVWLKFIAGGMVDWPAMVQAFIDQRYLVVSSSAALKKMAARS